MNQPSILTRGLTGVGDLGHGSSLAARWCRKVSHRRRVITQWRDDYSVALWNDATPEVIAQSSSGDPSLSSMINSWGVQWVQTISLPSKAIAPRDSLL